MKLVAPLCVIFAPNSTQHKYFAVLMPQTHKTVPTTVVYTKWRFCQKMVRQHIAPFNTTSEWLDSIQHGSA